MSILSSDGGGLILTKNVKDYPVIHGKIKTIAYTEIEYPKEWEHVDIIPLSCMHIGSMYFNEKRLKGFIKWIAEKDNRRAWILGDIFDAILTTSKGNMHEATYTLREAKLKAEELLEPIIAHIDIVIPGNHDNHVFNETTDEIVFDLCKYLGIESKYHFGDYTGVVRLGKFHGKQAKPVTYTFYVTHGGGGATTPQGKLKKLIDLAGVVGDCDLFIMAHIHDILTCKLEPFTVDSRNGKLKKTTQTFVSSSSWLDYGGYALEKKYKPAKTGSPRVRLYGDRKDIHVSI